MSRQQYDAYISDFGLRPSLRPGNGASIQVIGGRRTSIGAALLQIPFRDLRLIIDIHFLIIPDDIPSFLSMNDMADNGLDIYIRAWHIRFGSLAHSLRMVNYFLIENWGPPDMPFVLYTERELVRVHRIFEHATIRSTENILSRAGNDRLTLQTRKVIEKITRQCKVCASYAAAPRRFKVTMGADRLRFDNTVQVDTMFIHSKPVLDMADPFTHFSAATFTRLHRRYGDISAQ